MIEKHPSVINVYDNIIKSEEDARIYRGLELSNGMKVVLISDPKTDRSAAALTVHVGFMLDPPNLPGLAHFCEHMLFLGTKKYPTENEYHKFLKEHGGSFNAFTRADSTCYYFDISTKSLKDSLDRFAQFFLCPLFTECATEREVNAVNSEHEKNLQIDSWRLLQLEKSTCNPQHDYSKFGTGNVNTLMNIPKAKGINVRDELLKFHEKYYSSNLMGLAVLGKESIDELMDIVVPLFCNVSNKNLDFPEWKDHPFDSNHLKLQGFVVPVKEIKSLHISFPVPDLSDLYKSNPAQYLAHLIGHEGSGSLLSELKKLGWVNNLVSGYKGGAKGFAFFIVNMELSDEGLEHYNDIVTLMFQYLALLRQKGAQQWIFDECKNVSIMTFRFKDTEKPMVLTSHLSGIMYDYPMEEILCGPYLLETYRPDLICELLDKLTPETVRIAVIGKKFEEECTETEKWYGTRYKLKPIPEDVLEKWRNVTLHPNLELPLPNEFIPTNFELKPKDEVIPKHPQLIKNTLMSHLWFKQDNEFLLPKAMLNFEIESPMAYIDPLHCNMSHLFVKLVRDSLNEYAYAAELADLTYSLCNTKIGIFLTIKGYNDKQHVLLQKIMDRLTNFQIDEKRFGLLKQELIRGLKSFRAEQPHRHAMYYLSLLLAEKSWSNEELLSCIDDVTVDRMKQMIPQLLSRVHLEALIHGNITKMEAIELMDIVENALSKNVNAKHLMPSQLVKDREMQLCDGHHYIYEVINEVHLSSSVETYFQCGIQEARANVLLELLCELISEPCFTFLRVQEQLGYIVSSGIRRTNGAHGVRIIVQSDKLPSYVDNRIEAFIQFFDKYFQDLSEERFQKHVQALASIRLEKPKKLHIQSAKYWLEIASRQYNFERDNIEVAALETVTKDELYAFFKDLIAGDAPKRKKLSVHVISSSKSSDANSGSSFPCIDGTGDGLIPPPPAFRPPEKIEDVVAFKNSHGLYPLVPPCIYIPPPFYGIPDKSKL